MMGVGGRATWLDVAHFYVSCLDIQGQDGAAPNIGLIQRVIYGLLCCAVINFTNFGFLDLYTVFYAAWVHQHISLVIAAHGDLHPLMP